MKRLLFFIIAVNILVNTFMALNYHWLRANKLTNSKKSVQSNDVLSSEFKKIEKDLSEFFQQRIKIKISKNGKGKIEIPFQSEKTLDELIKILYS